MRFASSVPPGSHTQLFVYPTLQALNGAFRLAAEVGISTPSGRSRDHHRSLHRREGPRLRRRVPSAVHLRVRPRRRTCSSPRKTPAAASIENTHTPSPDAIGIFGDSILYVNLDECTCCTPATNPTSVRSGRSTPRSTFPTGRRRARSTTRPIPTRATTTRSSSSTAATSSPTDHALQWSGAYGDDVSDSQRFDAAYYRRFYGRRPVHDRRRIAQLGSGVLSMAAWWRVPIRGCST